MYTLIKEAILSRDYELSDMIKKINRLWIKNKITEDEKDELEILARNNANAENSFDVMKILVDLDKRVRVLEKTKQSESTVEEYVVGKQYIEGDMVMFEEKQYRCIAPSEQVCVWSPKDYPMYWEVI